MPCRSSCRLKVDLIGIHAIGDMDSCAMAGKGSGSKFIRPAGSLQLSGR
jgi:hypothetical protein